MSKARKWRTALSVLGVALAVGTTQANAQSSPDIPRTVSSRPDAISGGDVLVELGAPADSRWSASLDDRSVTSLFRRTESGEWRALLTGLRLGKNVLRIQAVGTPDVVVDLINHPLSGPIFSGPHQEPFICQTQANGLGPARDENCSAKTLVQYYYKSTDPVEIQGGSSLPAAPSLGPGFKVYNTAAPRPTDLAQTVTSDRHTVPYIVRREVGTINRAVYDIEFLHQPGQPLPTPWNRPASGWNGRLIYLVDGGCGPGYHQGTFGGPVGITGAPFLAEGYATATSTLNVTGNNCDDYVSAETLSMVKEHFIKTYGKPVYTMGWGESGGAYNQLLTAQNYPGLLDGLITGLSFADPFTTLQSVTDCALLDRAFSAGRQSWSPAQKTAVSGFASWQTCKTGWTDGKGSYWPIIAASKMCASVIAKTAIYDRKTNPRGVRCDLYDNALNILGRNPRTGFANRPLDNVGVQYGLLAFNRGQIDAEQFVELNEHAGGYDNDGTLVPQRTVADSQSLENAYRRGLVLSGGGDLSQVPIIDWRQYNDDNANNHDSIRSFITRSRLIAANGNADNQVIITFPRWSATDTFLFLSVHRWEQVYPEQSRYVVHQMDAWLSNVTSDSTSGSLAAKVARNKPQDLSDGCWLTNGEHVVDRSSQEGPSGRCKQEYPVYGDPRIAAGGPLTDDVLKCSLKPVNAADYTHSLSNEQLQRLKEAFPTGVCDYAAAGVAQQISHDTWRFLPAPDAELVSQAKARPEPRQ